MNILAKVFGKLKRTIRGQSANVQGNRQRSPNVRVQPRTILWTLNTGYCRILEVA